MSDVKPTMEEVIDMNLDQLKERSTSLNITFGIDSDQSTTSKITFEGSSAKSFD